MSVDCKNYLLLWYRNVLSDLYVQLCILSHLGRATPSNFNYVNQQTDDESEPLLSDTSDINLQRHGYSGDFYVCDELPNLK